MKNNEIVSVLVYPDNNILRVQVTRFVGCGHKVNTYTCRYEDKIRAYALGRRACLLNALVVKKMITYRRNGRGLIGENRWQRSQ